MIKKPEIVSVLRPKFIVHVMAKVFSTYCPPALLRVRQPDGQITQHEVQL